MFFLFTKIEKINLKPLKRKNPFTFLNFPHFLKDSRNVLRSVNDCSVKLFCIVSVQKWVFVLCFYLFSHAKFSKYIHCIFPGFILKMHALCTIFWWMKNDTSIIKAYSIGFTSLDCCRFFVSIDVEQAVGMSSMLQALRERRCTEDAHENT